MCVVCTPGLTGAQGETGGATDSSFGSEKMVFEGRRMTRWSRADLGNQKEEPGLCSYSPVWSHPENGGEESVCVQAQPSPLSLSIVAVFLSQCHIFGTAENAHRVADVTGRACREAALKACTSVGSSPLGSGVDAESQEFVRVMVVQGPQVRQTQQQFGEEGAVVWATAGDEGAQGLY